ncbi:MAG: hypothetical protein JWP75_339, partial [Frondihabitans sp.]|nr:hypothetical protein [Frondihabitans sp.]
IAIVLAILIPLIFLFWALRPNFITYHYNPSPDVQNFIRSIQTNTGLPLDGSRSYDEYSLYWFVWYFGVTFVFAVVFGMSAVVYRAIRSRRAGLLVFSVLTLGVALLYLNRINIAPDQMWAFRRVLPIVAPGFIIAAVYVMKWLGSRRNRIAIGASGAIGALVVAGTLGAWNPHLFTTTEYSNQATELRTICQQIGNAKSVVLIDRASNSYALSLKTFCGVDTVSLYTNTVVGQSAATTQEQLTATQDSLAKLEKRLGQGTPVVVFDRTLLNWQGTPPNDVQSTIIDVWQRTLLSQPRSYGFTTRTTWMGTVQPSGLVKGEQ